MPGDVVAFPRQPNWIVAAVNEAVRLTDLPPGDGCYRLDLRVGDEGKVVGCWPGDDRLVAVRFRYGVIALAPEHYEMVGRG